jgi:tetratricopeptide (TPR) repeat protein
MHGALVLVVVLAGLDARARYRADAFLGGAIAARNSTDADRCTKRIAYHTSRTEITPEDPAAWYDLAVAHCDLALTQYADSRYTDDAINNHIYPALEALRTARKLGSFRGEVHARLGFYARRFQKADAPVVYFQRAVSLLPTDPELWYALGVEAAAAGDQPLAERSWKQSLTLSPRQLKNILKAMDRLPTSDLQSRVLVEDPVVQIEAMNTLYPDARTMAQQRYPFLVKALAAASKPTLTPAQLDAISDSAYELNQPQPARDAWERIIEASTPTPVLHNGAARFYERMEMYDEAIPHLEWLVSYQKSSETYQDRLKAARHGADLFRKIDQTDTPRKR